VPPNFQRFLPIILIVFVLLFVLPAVFHKSTSTGPSSATLSTETIAAMGIVDKAEQTFKASHKGYTSHVADLLPITPALGHDLADGVEVQLDVSSDGQTFYAQVASSVLGMTRSRSDNKEIANGCLVIKSNSGVACPVKAAAKSTTTTTTTTGTTT
jgi:hypothetical protein